MVGGSGVTLKMIERLRKVMASRHHAHPVRRGIWRVMARMGMTGMHALPVSRRWVEIHRRTMALTGLSPDMAGFRLVQLSDLHYSPVVWKRYIEQYLEFVNRLRPDVVVITGDLITGGYRYAKGVAKVLKRLDTTYGAGGVVVTFGNHDYSIWGKNSPGQGDRRGDYLERVIEDEGIVVLRNEVLRVSRAGVRQCRAGDTGDRGRGELVLVGLDDEWTGRIDPATAFSLVAPRGDGEAVVCLNHNPINARELLGYPWQWMLSGHTHGRQLGERGLGKHLLAHKRREYTNGYYDVAGRHLYVNRGLSYGQRMHDWCRPEVTAFRLGLESK